MAVSYSIVTFFYLNTKMLRESIYSDYLYNSFVNHPRKYYVLNNFWVSLVTLVALSLVALKIPGDFTQYTLFLVEASQNLQEYIMTVGDTLNFG